MVPAETRKAEMVISERSFIGLVCLLDSRVIAWNGHHLPRRNPDGRRISRNEWNKPLSARLQSIPNKKSGDQTDFQDPYLFNTILHSLP